MTDSEEEDLETLYRKEAAKYRSATAKREFFSGIRFQLRMDSVQLILNSLKRQISRDNEIYPNWHFVTNNICLKAGFNNEDVAVQFSVREIMMTDYYRSEASQAIVNYASNKIVKTHGVEQEDMVVHDQSGNADHPDFFNTVSHNRPSVSRQTISNHNFQRLNSRASRDVDYFNKKRLLNDGDSQYMYTVGG